MICTSVAGRAFQRGDGRAPALKRCHFEANAKFIRTTIVDATDKERELTAMRIQGLLQSAARSLVSPEGHGTVAALGAQLRRLGPSDTESVLKVLARLKQFPMKVSLLTATGIGKDVNALRRRSVNDEVKGAALHVLVAWRAMYRRHASGVAFRSLAMDLEQGLWGAAQRKERYHHLAGALLRELEPKKPLVGAILGGITSTAKAVAMVVASVAGEERAQMSRARMKLEQS